MGFGGFILGATEGGNSAPGILADADWTAVATDLGELLGARKQVDLARLIGGWWNSWLFDLSLCVTEKSHVQWWEVLTVVHVLFV